MYTISNYDLEKYEKVRCQRSFAKKLLEKKSCKIKDFGEIKQQGDQYVFIPASRISELMDLIKKHPSRLLMFNKETDKLYGFPKKKGECKGDLWFSDMESNIEEQSHREYVFFADNGMAQFIDYYEEVKDEYFDDEDAVYKFDVNSAKRIPLIGEGIVWNLQNPDDQKVLDEFFKDKKANQNAVLKKMCKGAYSEIVWDDDVAVYLVRKAEYQIDEANNTMRLFIEFDEMFYAIGDD